MVENITNTEANVKANANRPKTVVQKVLSYVGLGPEGEYEVSQNHAADSTPRTTIGNHGMQNAQVFQAPAAPKGLQVVEVKDFSDSQKVADYFKANCPVLLNIEGTNPKYARRLVDFASGLIYGLNGNIRKVSTYMFLLELKSVAGNQNTEKSIQTYLQEVKTTGYN